MPEVVERLRLGSLGRQEFLLAGAEDDLACVDKVDLRSRKRKVKERNFLFSSYLILPLEGLVLEADIVVVKRSCD